MNDQLQLTLSRVTFPKNSKLRKIGNAAFGKTNIEKLEFPASLEVIDQNSFNLCSKITSITFPSDSRLKTIEASVFVFSQIRNQSKFPQVLKRLVSMRYIVAKNYHQSNLPKVLSLYL